MSQQLSTDPRDHGELQSPFDSPSGDHNNIEEWIAGGDTSASGEDWSEDIASTSGRPTEETPANSVSPHKNGNATTSNRALRLSRGPTRDRSRNRATINRRGDSSASRSPSLVTKLGMSLRGAVMGKTQLEAREPEDRQTLTAEVVASVIGEGSRSGGKHSSGSGAAGQVLRNRRRRRNNGTGGKKHHATENMGAREDNSTNDPNEILDSSFVFPDSPMAPDEPKNFPEAVHSYINARERIEQRTSASGPAFLPQAGHLSAITGDGINGWGKRRGSLDITKEASSTTQASWQQQPFTEAIFKAGVSETRHSTKQGILVEGNLQKFSPESVRGIRWHRRYFVLYARTCELRYYRSYAEAAWGRIPLDERGSIPLRLVVKIEQPSDKKYRGCRFDLVVLHRGDGRHPGLHIRPGQESRVYTTKTFKLNAADAQQRLLWVTVIETLMKRHGWGLDADRRRSMRAPGYGCPTVGPDNSPWDILGVGEAGERAVSCDAFECDVNGGSERSNTHPESSGHLPRLHERGLRSVQRTISQCLSLITGPETCLLASQRKATKFDDV